MAGGELWEVMPSVNGRRRVVGVMTKAVPKGKLWGVRDESEFWGDKSSICGMRRVVGSKAKKKRREVSGTQ